MYRYLESFKSTMFCQEYRLIIIIKKCAVWVPILPNI